MAPSVVAAFVAALAWSGPLWGQEQPPTDVADAADTADAAAPADTSPESESPEVESPESESPEPPSPEPSEPPAPEPGGDPSAAGTVAPSPRPLALPPPAGAAPIELDDHARATDGDAADTDLQLYGGIVVTGVGAALFVLAGMAVGRIDDIQNDNGFVAYRQGLTPNRHACDEAASGVAIDGAASPERVVRLCAEASRWEVTNYVAVPGGVAMVAMGLYLILTSDTARGDAPLALIPELGPRQAGLTLTGRF